MTDTALRAYLLGRLTEPEVALVETRLIEDPELFSQMQTAEDDLFDAFARGTLDAIDRASFLERFGRDGDRRRFAAAFVTRTSSRKVVPFLRRPFIDFAIAATLMIVVGAVVMRRGPEPVVPVNTAPAASVPAAVVAPVTTIVPLAIGTSRAEGAPSKVTLGAGATRIEFRIRLNPADKYPVYAAQIRSQSDNIVWGDAITATVDGGDLIASAVVPADRLPSGTYEIAIRGGANAASLDDLGFVTIEVARNP